MYYGIEIQVVIIINMSREKKWANDSELVS